MNQEQIIQFQVMEEEANKLGQQLQMIEANLNEINEIKESLSEINKKDTKEILANLGKKIYIPVEIMEKSLIIEVGNKKLVKKSIPGAIEMITKQIIKLNTAREEITERLDILQKEANLLMQELNSSLRNKNEECNDKECRCRKG